MRHFLLVGRDNEVLGVWEAADEVSALKRSLVLSLKYPNCRTVLDRAESFEAFKAGLAGFDFGALLPEPMV